MVEDEDGQSDTEGTEGSEQVKKEKDPIEKFLNQVPPDFDKAEIHGVSKNCNRYLAISNGPRYHETENRRSNRR